MKPTKMSLANMQGKLSRAEMKKIMAGSGACGDYPSTQACCCATGVVDTCQRLVNSGCSWIGGSDCKSGCPGN